MVQQLTDLQQKGLYDPSFEHDNCGIGAIIDIEGRKSHRLLHDALSIVENLEHRAGKDAEGKTGDGVGILTQIPHRFFSKILLKDNIKLPEERKYGVGMFFFPQNDLAMRQAKSLFEVIVRKSGLSIIAWRKVDTDPSVLGHRARDCMPEIYQVFINRPASVKDDLDYDRMLYIIRREFEQSNINTYIPSLSCRTIVYKGMFLVGQLRTFFTDLMDPDYETAIAMVHSRFSTNTAPSWNRAHPNRFIVHNGEINTIRGNVNWLNARESKAKSPFFPDMEKVFPVVDDSGSDSAMFDNCLEYLMMTGHSLAHAMVTMIPEPWEKDPSMSQEKQDFYRYQTFMMEPWDGPAAICFCDGTVIGGMLDRNGLRPARYYVTKDDRVVLSSEAGAVPVAPEMVLYKGRLEPGRIFLVNTAEQRIVEDEEIKHLLATSHPYGDWCREHIIEIDRLVAERGSGINDRFVPFDLKEQQTLYRTLDAAEAGAVAAINGTFYNMKQGGSVCYLQIDGAVSDTTKGSNMQLRANGAVVIRNGKLSVEPWNQEKEQTFRSKYLPSSQSHNSQSARSHNSQSAASATKSAAGDRVSVMATMPLLVQDGHPVEILLNKGFSDKRHPRSVIFEKDGRVCLMVIDGRSKGNASGMTLDEVQTYILSIDGGKGCTSAVNLDGGGSSTLWISTSAFSSQPGTLSFDSSSPTQFSDTGVLNHPSDNGKFDHKGERSVANSIIVLRK